MRLLRYIIVLSVAVFAYDYSNINPLLEATVNSAKTSSTTIYTNRAHNFKLRLPKDVFQSLPQKEDNNFALFKSLDNETTLLIAFKKESRSLKKIYQDTVANLKNRADIKFGFHKYFGKWYVVSILDRAKDIISYQKGFKKNGTHIFYILSYPSYQKKRYDSVIKELNKNFGYTSHPRKKRKTSTIKGGTWCDKYYRGCSLECFDRADEDSCLNRCDQKLARCYKSGKFR